MNNPEMRKILKPKKIKGIAGMNKKQLETLMEEHYTAIAAKAIPSAVPTLGSIDLCHLTDDNPNTDNEDANTDEVDAVEAGLNKIVNVLQKEEKALNLTPDSPEWTGFLMSQLTPDEKTEEKGTIYPSCDGLRRLFNTYCGNIIEAESHTIKTPSALDLTATVEFRMSYICKFTNMQKTRHEVFDVNSENTSSPYLECPTATAATKAEARALRKAMGLIKILSRDERMSEPAVLGDSKSKDGSASDAIKKGVNMQCKRLGIDMKKLFQYHSMSLELGQMTSEDGKLLMTELTKYARGPEQKGLETPDEIKIKLDKKLVEEVI